MFLETMYTPLKPNIHEIFFKMILHQLLDVDCIGREMLDDLAKTSQGQART